MTVDEVRTRLLAYLPESYTVEEGSNNWGIMTGYAVELDEVYNQIDFLHFQIGVNTAESGYLDDIGLLFRLQRQLGETDDQFRARIKSFFVAFSGGGTIEAIETAVARVTGLPVGDVTVTDIFDLKFMVTFIVAELGAIIGTVIETVEDAKAAGTFAYYTAENTYATEGVACTEAWSFDPFPGIIVSVHSTGDLAEL